MLREIGQRHGRSPGEVAIAWVLRRPEVTAAIVGMRSAKQVEGVIGAARFRLSPEEISEIGARRRMGNPLATSSYGEAHNDYLHPFAEAGIPAGLLVLAAAALLLRGLVLAARRPADARRGEVVFLLAFLGAGAVAALTWFPFQRPITAIPLLLAAGRAWKLSADSDAGAAAKA